MPIRSSLIAGVAALLCSGTAQAAAGSCSQLPSYDALKAAVTEARRSDNGGLDHDMWGAVVDRTGAVCAVVYTGKQVGDQWPGSRAIAVEKANTANAFSLPGFALSTANLYSAAQPGGYLFGILATNPVEPKAITAGEAATYGSSRDPLVGQRPGGGVVFAGGLALYDKQGTLLGALGVSGDTSCGDHNIAWKTRHALDLDYVPAGPSDQHNDAIIYDVSMVGKSISGFGHPTCGNKEDQVARDLPGTRVVGK